MTASDSQRFHWCDAHEQGMSLLEVLVSLVLILLTVPLMVALQIGALKLNGDAGEVDHAMWAAQAKVEELRTAGYASVIDGNDEYSLPDGRVVTRKWSVTESEPVVDTKTVKVTASERDNVGARQAEIAFVLARRSALSGGGGGG